MLIENVNIEEIMELCRKSDDPEKVLEHYKLDEELKQEIYFNVLRERRRVRRERTKNRENLSEDEKIELYLKNINLSQREELLEEISEKGRVSLINKVVEIKDKIDIIKTLSEDKKIEFLDKVNIELFKTDILKSCSYQKRIEYVKKIKKKSNQRKIVQTLLEDAKDNSQKIELLNLTNNLDMNDMHKVVANEIEEDVLLENLEKLDKQIIKKFRANGKFKIENINARIDEFMFCEGVDNTDIKEKLELLKKLNKNNEEICSTIDFEFLSQKNAEMLTQERFEQMACYPQIQEKFLEISNDDKKIETFNKCLNNFNKSNQNAEWTQVIENLLEGFVSSEYEELLSDLENTEDIEVSKLTKILSNSNMLGVKTVSDLENYEKIKIDVCQAIMSGDNEKIKDFPKIECMSNIDKKKFAILEKLYSQDLKTAENLIKRYGRDIDTITYLDESSIVCQEYIQSLKVILETENEKLLDDIYNIPLKLEENEIDLITMERQLKNIYAKEYTKDLFDIKNGKRINEEERIPMYSAGTDFKMIVTSIGAYHRNSPKNFKENWNRNMLASQGFCASYIRNDMLGTADIPHLCYGFSEMAEDALMLSGSGDIFSDAKKMNATAAHSEEYLSPETQINETINYNEMVFKRIQNGKRKQPDYIVVFKKDGKIPNLEEAKRAVQDFDGKLPIVVVDVNECERVETNKIKKMFDEYKETQSPEVLLAIKQKIRNNSVANPEFVSKIPEIENFIKSINEDSIEFKKQVTKKNQILSKQVVVENHEKIDDKGKNILKISKCIGNIINKENFIEEQNEMVRNCSEITEKAPDNKLLSSAIEATEEITITDSITKAKNKIVEVELQKERTQDVSKY